MIITIDGPAGAGKSTVAKQVATKLGFSYLDTGAMYRAVALEGIRQKIDWNQPAQLVKIAQNLCFEWHEGHLTVNGKNFSDEIRSPEVTQNTHFAADNPMIREIMVKHQREIVAEKNIVTEGRDQGTAVFPQAEFKFFLIATPEERARRRIEEYRKNGKTANETEINEAEILEQINLRDARDSVREVGPLREPEDSVRIVTDGLGIDDVVSKIVTILQEGSLRDKGKE